MPKQKLGDKPKLDWIGEGSKAEPSKELNEALNIIENLPMESKKKVRAERLSIIVDPDIADEFNKLCDMWRAAYPNTQKKDICNKMLREFKARYAPEIKKRLSQVLSG